LIAFCQSASSAISAPQRGFHLRVVVPRDWPASFDYSQPLAQPRLFNIVGGRLGILCGGRKIVDIGDNLLGQIVGLGLRFIARRRLAQIGSQQEVGISIGLIGAPSVTRGKAFMGHSASAIDGVAEGLARE
jgi:hypothetical protein